MESRWKIVKKRSTMTSGIVYVIQHKKYPNLYKMMAFGERAEFKDKNDAEDYLRQINMED